MLTGLPVKSREEAVVAADQLLEKGCKTAVITLGGEGAMILGRKCPDKPMFVEAPKVQAIDTTVIFSLFSPFIFYCKTLDFM
jgi:sugar/nucleoside kinase (ribokinase family)